MPQLDGLRAVAVFAVLYAHFFPKSLRFLDVSWGTWGVRLFFVLSGFLITQILIAERLRAVAADEPRRNRIVKFYLRRLLRLWPLLIVTLCVAYVAGSADVRQSFWWHIFYMSNVYFAVIQSWAGPVSHLWTLAVEEQFYLIWPWLILFMPSRWLPKALFCLIAVSILFGIVGWFAGLNKFTLWVIPPANFDALAIGGLLALGITGQASRQYIERRWGYAAGIALLVFVGNKILLYALRDSRPDLRSAAEALDVSDIALMVIFAWIILLASRGIKGPIGALLGSGALIYLGKISYGIYLLHLFVYALVADWGLRHGWPADQHPYAAALAETAITVALAALSWHLMERPLARVRRRIR